ncbi:thioredoxin family protein [Pedobacter sp. AW31-3R]|uniref:thioredoxin family protein n=1 Tax=Pedobacter sp. AW31-3R TaxID=3445781 RepID=UPI003F9FCFF1
MKYKLLILLWLPLGAFGQQGIHFLEDTAWEKVVAIAKQQNKMIFVDCYASWCIPCKVIDQAVFQTAIAGDYFNQNFISYKVQMDTAKTDGPERIKYYPDASKLKVIAEVVNFPTYAFFNPDAELLHRFVGGTQDPERFIAMAAEALDPERQFYTLKHQLENTSDPDRELLKHAAIAYQRNADSKNGYEEKSRSLASDYIKKSGTAELLTKENIDLIMRYTSSTAHSGFTFVLDHVEEIDAIAGNDIAMGLIERCVFKSVIDPALSNDEALDWRRLKENLTGLYPAYATALLGKAKISYYSKKDNWPAYILAVNQMINSGSEWDTENNLANYAFEVYTHTGNKNCLREALKWSDRSLKKDPVSEERLIINASILYALGAQKKAVEVLHRAEEMASDPEIKAYIVATLKKVRSNLPLLERN